MKIRDKILIQKYYLNVFNGILLALGLMILTFGLWFLFDRNNGFSELLSPRSSNKPSSICKTHLKSDIHGHHFLDSSTSVLDSPSEIKDKLPHLLGVKAGK